MSPREAIKHIVDECTDVELVALLGALQHPDKVAIGEYFSDLARRVAEGIECRVVDSTVSMADLRRP